MIIISGGPTEEQNGSSSDERHKASPKNRLLHADVLLITHMEKPSVSLLNAVNNAPFPTACDGHERFVLAEPGQTFKVFVSLNRTSSIAWPEGSTHLRVAVWLDEKIRMRSKFISRQNLADRTEHAEEPDEV